MMVHKAKGEVMKRNLTILAMLPVILAAAPATTRTTAPSDESADLRRIVARLQKELAEAKAEIATLRKANESLADKLIEAAKATPKKQQPDDTPAISKGMKYDEVVAALNAPDVTSDSDGGAKVCIWRWYYQTEELRQLGKVIRRAGVPRVVRELQITFVGGESTNIQDSKTKEYDEYRKQVYRK